MIYFFLLATSSEPQQIPLSLPVSQTPMLKEVKQESIPENISMMSPAEVSGIN